MRKESIDQCRRLPPLRQSASRRMHQVYGISIQRRKRKSHLLLGQPLLPRLRFRRPLKHCSHAQITQKNSLRSRPPIQKVQTENVKILGLYCFIMLRSLKLRELAFVYGCVKALLGEQLLVCSLLHYATVLHNKNKVGLLYGGKSVCDHTACTSVEKFRYCLLYSSLGAQVYGGCRLVQQQNGGGSQHQSRQT